jgi:hypothetical protein
MITAQCFICLRYRGELECDAFPKGIPVDILTGQVDHSQAYRGDGGLLFQPPPKASLEKSMTSAEADEVHAQAVNKLTDTERRAYARIKSAVKRRGYEDKDFEVGGPLYGWSTNELAEIARGSGE